MGKASRLKRLRRHFQTDLSRLDCQLDQVTDSLSSRNVPEVLYHYTTWAGAQGILTTREFWATSHDCTNDPAELTSVDSVIGKVATELLKTAQNTAAAALETFIEMYPRLQVTRMAPIYIACFTEAGDDEGQWRTYGDNGSGVCLGIRILPERAPENPGLGYYLVKVQYSEDAWRDSLNSKFAEIATLLEPIPVTKKSIILGVRGLSQVAAFASIGGKKTRWENEREWRLVVMPKGGATVEPMRREAGGKEIRYVSIHVREPTRPLALANVILGPCQDPEAARAQATRVLEEARYTTGSAEYPAILASGLAAWHDVGDGRPKT